MMKYPTKANESRLFTMQMYNLINSYNGHSSIWNVSKEVMATNRRDRSPTFNDFTSLCSAFFFTLAMSFKSFAAISSNRRESSSSRVMYKIVGAVFEAIAARLPG